MVVLYAARHKVPVPSLARWLLGLGIAATLTANIAQGWSHGPLGAVVAACPAVSLIGSYELLVWLIRTSGAAERRPSAEHLCEGAACSAATRPLPPAADGDRPGESERDTSDPVWRLADQAAGQSTIPASDDMARRSSCARLSVVSWLKDSVRPPVQDRARASMRSAAWRPATPAPGVTTHGNPLHDCRDSSPACLR